MGGTGAVAELASELVQHLPGDAVVIPGSEIRDPDLTVLSPAHGLLAIDVCEAPVAAANPASITTDDGRELQNPLVAFAPKIERLRDLCSQVEGVPFHASVVMMATDAATLRSESRALPERLVTSADRLSSRIGSWEAAYDGEAFAQLRERLVPAQNLEVTLEEVFDPDRAAREDLRARFDVAQAQLADGLNDGVALVEGVAGSGKSLVLASRARQLALVHPDWQIDVVCFNRTLVPYLSRLVGDHPGVRVETVHSWLGTHGIRQPSLRADDFEDQLRQRLERALNDGASAGSADAVLVDEAQDLSPEMLEILRSAVRPGHGGMLVVRDLAQSLYRETSDVLDGQDVQRTVLLRNYRNTARIGCFALESVFGTDRGDGAPHDPRRPIEPEFASEGQKVQVVWGDSWDDQAAFIARECRRLVRDGVVSYEDIGILYTQFRGQTKRLLAALEDNDIPHEALTWDRESRRSFDLEAPGVKALTVHSAKGLEFPVVFLFGVEALRVPETLDHADEKQANFARVAYVGMTRAKDMLYLTYTRPNVIVQRCLALANVAEFRRFPDDYPSEVRDG